MFDFGSRTYIMGIVNVTPDSFSGDGLAGDPDRAVRHALRLVEEGADILDVGGESTRPGAEPVAAEEELARVVPIIEALRRQTQVPICVDTCKSVVARAAVKAGAKIINDVSGLHFDAQIACVAAESSAMLVLMHMQGTPRTMQQNPQYTDVVRDIIQSLSVSINQATEAGIPRDRLIIDPGIGFGKTVDHNLAIIRRLAEFRQLGCPLLIGTSRKSFIGKILDLPVEDRLEGTAATVALSIANGVDIVRVHDVKAISRVARMCDAIVRVKT